VTSRDTHLVLVRHGESQAQVDQFISGHETCTGLSDLGRRQAAALRDRLARTQELGTVDALYASVLPRAIETAEIISSAVGQLDVQRECAWCEVHAGEAEGLAYTEFLERFGEHGISRTAFRQNIPGAETWAEFAVRAGTRLQRVADDHPGERVVVVTHGGVITASFVALGLLGIPAAMSLAGEATRNTSLTEWYWSGTDWHLQRYNDAAHLTEAN
jgi:probable phosphoglycerate mutase